MEAQKTLDKLLSLRKKKHIESGVLATVCAGLDLKEEALDWLNKGYQEQSFWMVYLKIDANFWFRDIYSDERYQSLMKKAGFDE